MRIDRVLVAFMAVAPHVVEQFRAPEDAAGMTCKVQKQIESMLTARHAGSILKGPMESVSAGLALSRERESTRRKIALTRAISSETLKGFVT